jgi:hypothetical protein
METHMKQKAGPPKKLQMSTGDKPGGFKSASGKTGGDKKG